MCRFFRQILYCLVFFTASATCAENRFQPSVMRAKIGLDFNAIMFEEQSTQITLIGQINPGTTETFRKILDKEKNIKVVFIDSPGGFVDSAIEIATIIRKRQLDLVVDGRCLSACANFIFPSAMHKVVLPGSFVGIHEQSISYTDNGVLKITSGNDTEQILKAASDKLALDKFKQLKIEEKEFYENQKISQNLYVSYDTYLNNRKNSFGKEKINFEPYYPNCPPVQMWALNKQQLTSMGIKDIGEFWYPSNDLEKKKLSSELKFPQGSIYFGEAHDLEQTCKGISSSWIFRRFYDVKSSILSLLNFQKSN